ncbi:hypothetical protein BJ742DRAFT_845137 [Cladochytrium replicatum]|nr:hypothetical protein BJ742DRAFT_845137 [Cladochytrium replicatum]
MGGNTMGELGASGTGITPVRLGVAYKPPALILEYRDIGSGRARRRKMPIRTLKNVFNTSKPIPPSSTIIEDLLKRHERWLRPISETQLKRFVDLARANANASGTTAPDPTPTPKLDYPVLSVPLIKIEDHDNPEMQSLTIAPAISASVEDSFPVGSSDSIDLRKPGTSDSEPQLIMSKSKDFGPPSGSLGELAEDFDEIEEEIDGDVYEDDAEEEEAPKSEPTPLATTSAQGVKERPETQLQNGMTSVSPQESSIEQTGANQVLKETAASKSNSAEKTTTSADVVSKDAISVHSPQTNMTSLGDLPPLRKPTLVGGLPPIGTRTAVPTPKSSEGKEKENTTNRKVNSDIEDEIDEDLDDLDLDVDDILSDEPFIAKKQISTTAMTTTPPPASNEKSMTTSNEKPATTSNVPAVFVESNTDLNKLDDATLNTVKKQMDLDFQARQIKPGDPGFQYDVQKTFVSIGEKNEWDTSEEASEKSNYTDGLLSRAFPKQESVTRPVIAAVDNPIITQTSPKTGSVVPPIQQDAKLTDLAGSNVVRAETNAATNPIKSGIGDVLEDDEDEISMGIEEEIMVNDDLEDYDEESFEEDQSLDVRVHQTGVVEVQNVVTMIELKTGIRPEEVVKANSSAGKNEENSDSAPAQSPPRLLAGLPPLPPKLSSLGPLKGITDAKPPALSEITPVKPATAPGATASLTNHGLNGNIKDVDDSEEEGGLDIDDILSMDDEEAFMNGRDASIDELAQEPAARALAPMMKDRAPPLEVADQLKDIRGITSDTASDAENGAARAVELRAPTVHVKQSTFDHPVAVTNSVKSATTSAAIEDESIVEEEIGEHELYGDDGDDSFWTTRRVGVVEQPQLSRPGAPTASRAIMEIKKEEGTALDVENELSEIEDMDAPFELSSGPSRRNIDSRPLQSEEKKKVQEDDEMPKSPTDVKQETVSGNLPGPEPVKMGNLVAEEPEKKPSTDKIIELPSLGGLSAAANFGEGDTDSEGELDKSFMALHSMKPRQVALEDAAGKGDTDDGSGFTDDEIEFEGELDGDMSFNDELSDGDDAF